MNSVMIAEMLRNTFKEKGYPEEHKFMFYRKTEDNSDETQFVVFSGVLAAVEYHIFDAVSGKLYDYQFERR